jgi:hypothetical protein
MQSLFSIVGSYCTDPYSPYSKKRARFLKLSFGTKIEAIFGGSLAAAGPYYAGRIALCWARFSRHRFQGGHTAVRIWARFLRQKSVGTDLLL